MQLLSYCLSNLVNKWSRHFWCRFWILKSHLQLLDSEQPFSKELLQALVSEIVLDGNRVKIKGGYGLLVGSVKLAAQKKKLSTPQEVLSFNKGWRPRDDSNVRPLP